MRVYRWTSLVMAGFVVAVLVTPVHAQQVEIKPAAKVKRDKYFILPDEIAEKPDLTNAYEVVKVLRNQWLRVTRGSGGGLGSGASPTSGAYVPRRNAVRAPARKPPEAQAVRCPTRVAHPTPSPGPAWNRPARRVRCSTSMR